MFTDDLLGIDNNFMWLLLGTNNYFILAVLISVMFFQIEHIFVVHEMGYRCALRMPVYLHSSIL